jgi:hypothetical protein
VHDPKVEAYIGMIANWSIRIPAKQDVADALRRIERAAPIPQKQSLRLLALRRYLRMQDIKHVDLHSIWTWGDDRVRESMHHGAGRDLMNEARRVQDSFARNNPGYALGVSPPRSLARQVELWVASSSATTAGERLLKQTIQRVAKPEYELPPPVAKVLACAAWLRDRPVDPEPGNAAPGTSDHGQVKAVDFVVMQGSRVVAGTSRSTVSAQWTAPGWAQKLVEATAGTRLRGPLRHPYEPWHWSLD